MGASVIDIVDKFPIRFDTQRMLAELKGLETSEWLEHYDKGLSNGWVAIPLVSLDGRMGDSEAQRAGTLDQFKRTPYLERLPYFKEIVDGFKCPQGRVRVLKLLPGAKIGEHRDVGLEVANLAFKRVRLHIPIQTNPEAVFYVGGERFHMREGGLYYANFSKVHSVRNDGTTDRVHLVLDLQVNDWLAQFFPKPSLSDRLSGLTQRLSLPVFWKLRWWRTKYSRKLWNAYEGSPVQRIRHRLMGRA
jgi:aspartyl/asparaginyl beta-hydroxylase